MNSVRCVFLLLLVLIVSLLMCCCVFVMCLKFVSDYVVCCVNVWWYVLLWNMLSVFVMYSVRYWCGLLLVV